MPKATSAKQLVVKISTPYVMPHYADNKLIAIPKAVATLNKIILFWSNLMIIRVINNNTPTTSILYGAVLLASPPLTQGYLNLENNKLLFNLFTDPNKRNAYIRSHQAAREADTRVGDIVGSDEYKDAVYAFAAEIIEALLQETHGDKVAVLAKIAEAELHPESLLAHLSVEQQQKIETLSMEIHSYKTH